MAIRLVSFHPSLRNCPLHSHRTGLHLSLLLILLPSVSLLPPPPTTLELSHCPPHPSRGPQSPAPRPCSRGAAPRQGHGSKSGLAPSSGPLGTFRAALSLSATSSGTWLAGNDAVFWREASPGACWILARAFPGTRFGVFHCASALIREWEVASGEPLLVALP